MRAKRKPRVNYLFPNGWQKEFRARVHQMEVEGRLARALPIPARRKSRKKSANETRQE